MLIGHSCIALLDAAVHKVAPYKFHTDFKLVVNNNSNHISHTVTVQTQQYFWKSYAA